MRAHPRLNRQLTVAAFALSAISTVVMLFLLASAEPFERHGNAPSVMWSILLWAMVGIGTWVVILRLVILILVPIAGILYRKSEGDAAAAAGAPDEAVPGPSGEPPAEPPLTPGAASP